MTGDRKAVTVPNSADSPPSGKTVVVLAVFAAAGSLLPADGRPGFFPQRLFLAVPDFAQALVIGGLAFATMLLVPRRRWPFFAVTAASWLLRSTWPVVVIASYVAAVTYRRPIQLIGYAIVATAFALGPALTSGLLAQATPDPYSLIGGAALFVWLPMATGLWVNGRRQLLDGLRERAEQLEREQVALARQARAEERTRIARDMHDVVAHRVSLMVLHAGALEMNAPNDYTATEAELIRSTGKDALAQLREVLGVLKSSQDTSVRREPVPTLRDLDRLLEQSRAAGVQVVRRDEGSPRDLSAMVANTAYRIVREALTNVHKHAGQVLTTVVVRYLPRAVEIQVDNDPPQQPPEPLPGSGMGLVSLRERVEVMGGRFVAETRTDGGFSVFAQLPEREEAE